MSVEYTVVSAPFLRGGPNEDHVAVYEGGDHRSFFVAVADGHGWELGEEGRYLRKSPKVAAFARDVAVGLCNAFLQFPDPASLTRCFEVVSGEADDAWRGHTGLNVGAVASCVFVTHTQVHLAQTGDCRLYAGLPGGWSGGYKRLSRDHDANHPSERKRLKPFLDSGQFRFLPPESGDGLSRVKLGTPDRLHRWVEGRGFVQGMAPTRVFGDWEFQPAVTYRPECRAFELSDFAPGELFALCSDGGNWLVEEAFRRFRGETSRVPLRNAANSVRSGLHKAGDDVSVVFFRVINT